MHRLSDLFLTSSGRIGRIAFLLGAGVLLGLWTAFNLTAPLAVRDTVGWLVAAVLLYSGACVVSQRLHDRGRSGWWSGPVLLLFALAWPYPTAPFDWIALGVLALVAVDLVVLPGQRAFNRHGAPSRNQSGSAPS